MAARTITGLRTRWRDGSLGQILGASGIYLALLLVIILAAVLSPAFYRPANVFNVLRQASALGILSIGQTIVIIAGGIDLSVASTMQLAAVVAAEVSKGRDAMVPIVILVCLSLGGLVGVVNGLLVTKRRVPPFIATLAVSIVTTGLRLVATYAAPAGGLPPLLRFFGQQSTGPVPNATIIFALFAIVAAVMLNKTTFGRRVYATGDNREAARLSGVNVDRIQLATYVICGIMAAIAGLVLAGYVGYADQWIGRGYELDSIAAPIVGGASFAGGQGSIAGTVAGVLLVAILLNLVLLLNLDAQYQLVVRGLVIVAAVAMHSVQRRD